MPEYPQENLPKEYRNDDSRIIIMQDPGYQIRPVQQMFSALGGAIATAFTITPVEVVKTRMQLPLNRCNLPFNGAMSHMYRVEEDVALEGKSMKIHRQFKFRGIKDTLKAIKESQGLRGFYSGLAPTLVSALPSTVLYFVAYEQFKRRYILLKYNEHFEMLPDMTFFVPIMSGVSARVLAAAICTPFEMIRIKMQADQMSYAQVFQVVRNIVKSRGVVGLWYGLVPVLLRDTPFTAIYWTTYESLKAHYHQELPTFYFSFLAGATAGALAATLTTPLDVVTTRSQVEAGEISIIPDAKQMKILSPSTIRHQLAQIYRLEGLKGLFAGLTMRLIKVAPSCAIMIAVFEYGNRYFYKRNKMKNESK